MLGYKTRACVVTILGVVSSIISTPDAYAQFSGLATNDDGSQLYYSSELAFAGAQGVLETRLVRVDQSGSRPVAERRIQQATGNRTNHYLLSRPTVSGDGTLVAFNATSYCNQGSGCEEARAIPDTRSVVRGLAGYEELEFEGHLRISRAGRFALLYDFGVDGGSHRVDLLDITTGQRTPLYMPRQKLSVGLRASLASDGTAVLVDEGRLVVLRPNQVQTVPTSALLEEATIDDQGRIAVCLTQADAAGAVRLIEVDLRTGRETPLTQPLAGLSSPSMSGDGGLVLYLADADGLMQAFLLERSTGASRRITSDREGIAEAILSGDGKVAYVITGARKRVLRLDLGEPMVVTQVAAEESAGATAHENKKTESRSAADPRAVIRDPAAGSTLKGSQVTFEWTSGTGVSEYKLSVGTTPTANDLHAYVGTTTSRSVANLPTDSRAIFVRLGSRVNGVDLEPLEYVYTAFESRATILTPAPKSTLAGSSATFTWTAGTGFSSYQLLVGAKLASSDLDSYTGSATSRTVANLPTDGSTIYVRLLSGGPNAPWKAPLDYTYTAFDSRAKLVSPVPGSTVKSPSLTLTWTPVAGAEYRLDVGTAPGRNDLHGYLGTATSRTVTNLPAVGGTIYARLSTKFNGNWQAPRDYTFTAIDRRAVMLTPVAGSTLSGDSVTFIWGGGVDVTEYRLDVWAGSRQVFNSGSLGAATSVTVTGLPTDGSPIFVQLASRINGVLQPSNNYSYTAFDPRAQILTPVPGTLLAGPSVTFTWSAGTGVTEYRLHLNSAWASMGTATSAVVDVPVAGTEIDVQLQSRINGNWQLSKWYRYRTPDHRAAMLTPAPGSELSSASPSFTWSAGVGVSEYELYVATEWLSLPYSGLNYVRVYQGTGTSHSATGLPTDGRTIYVQLRSRINGNWQTPQSYTYKAFDAYVAAEILTPAHGSTLPGSSATFTWSTGVGVTSYELFVNGTSRYSGTATSVTVAGLPTNGSQIPVTLRSTFLNSTGDWLYTY
ncbi:MAG: TolB family protein, partial [Bryobacteraceae bacterium]